jgi:hypothetical protein
VAVGFTNARIGVNEVIGALDTVIERIRAYFQEQLALFDRSALWSTQVAKEGAFVAFWWGLPAFLVVWCVANYPHYLPSSYLSAAISEGIGPHLWNAIGTLGLVLVGLALLFPKSKYLAKSAYQVLTNTYAIGGLSFGLLFGQLATSIASANIQQWKLWLLGVGGGFLAIQLLFLNFSLWYLGHLMVSRESGDGFLSRVERMHLRLRVPAAVLIAGLPVVLLFAEK